MPAADFPTSARHGRMRPTSTSTSTCGWRLPTAEQSLQPSQVSKTLICKPPGADIAWRHASILVVDACESSTAHPGLPTFQKDRLPELSEGHQAVI